MWKKIYRAKSGDPMVPGFHENILLRKEDKEVGETIKLYLIFIQGRYDTLPSGRVHIIEKVGVLL